MDESIKAATSSVVFETDFSLARTALSSLPEGVTGTSGYRYMNISCKIHHMSIAKASMTSVQLTKTAESS